MLAESSQQVFRHFLQTHHFPQKLMLKHLSISHYALIDELETDWSPGFSVITGETGAGKSIILGAIGLMMGGRADARTIRDGHKKCVVEGIFVPTHPMLRSVLEAHDVDFDESECIVRREVSLNGKSRAFVNDTPVAVGVLKEIAPLLIDVHSQHQNLLLRGEQFLIDTLDSFGELSGDLDKYTLLYKEWKNASARLRQLTQEAEEAEREKDLLTFNLEKLEELAWEEGEQESLEQEQEVLSHAEEIKQSLFEATACIQSDETDVLHLLRRAAEAVNRIAAHLPGVEEEAKRLEEARIEIDDIQNSLLLHADKVEFNPARLDFVQERLNAVYQLEQKHHVSTDADLLALGREWKEKLDQMETAGDEIEKLSRQIQAQQQRLTEEAATLSKKRKLAAKGLTDKLMELLHTLGMPHVSLDFRIEPSDLLRDNGADKISLWFSANKDIPLREVGEIASGGEIARVMLALKSILSKSGRMPCIVFDEIDTGVSGKMAGSMAEVMKLTSEHCQVICITHLPQIAAAGTHHYKVFKSEDETGTHSHISLLSEEERVHEIATILSGAELSEAALENARTLLRHN